MSGRGGPNRGRKLLDLLLPPRLKEKNVGDMLNNSGETVENDQAVGIRNISLMPRGRIKATAQGR